ncbi:FYVE, RhoGEF and PH domain-containing protein 3-like [Macrosteles quadrilineatus]|uniref:FYVE, RhoGEF and PH domain-containing protein 3-like n=1 Tax=Macrosteles quadrilineatus TaxID=74068 RepID=UPI0023E0F96C|nr:FYVE, RhoGEF and PH domain-containing protein 3-like [Macrosteles quadrilineatus]
MESCPSTPQPTLSHELRALINQRNILTAKSKSKVLNALDKQIEENRKKQQLDLRNKVIEEIFTSEVSYLSQLEVIKKYFKEPLESSDLISGPTKRTLFGNIESIYQVNGELVNQLKTRGTNVAAAFLHLAPFFKIYSMYAYNYKSAIRLLEDLPTHNPRLGEWIRSQERRPEVGNKLSALLITPIQRLPRYRLLLRQLLSLTPDSHPHRTTLVEAVKEVENATSHINNLVFEQETHSRLLTLQNCLLRSKPCIVGPNKKLLKEGILMKMSANGQKAQKRYFILLSDSVVYCKLLAKEEGMPHESGSLQSCCVLPIGKCSVENVLGQGVFNLTCRSETYILFSEHREDASDWVTAIRDAIAQHHENLQTLRKKSSSRHTLQMTRKRKLLKENNNPNNGESPMKKMKSHTSSQDEDKMKQHCDGKENPQACQETVQKNNYLQSIKSLFMTFGETVRTYMFPGPSSRSSNV